MLSTGSGAPYLPASGDEQVPWTDPEPHQDRPSPTLGDLFSPSLDFSAEHRHVPTPHPLFCSRVTISLRCTCVPCILPLAPSGMLQGPSLATPLTTAASRISHPDPAFYPDANLQGTTVSFLPSPAPLQISSACAAATPGGPPLTRRKRSR